MAIKLEKKQPSNNRGGDVRYLVVGVLLATAFFASYSYATSSRNSSTSPAFASGVGGQGASAAGGASGGGGGGCCGGGGAQKPVQGSTTVAGGVQKVTIDLTTGSYSPNQISAKAGVPLELVFKGPATGCNGSVQSQQLGFQQDMSQGGTIKVAALQPGTYSFSCSMGMYTAQIVVK